MAYIIETKNPYEPLKSVKHVHEGGITIWQWLQLTYPGFKEFQIATICLLNGEPLMRKDWDRRIGEKDIVNFVTLAGEVATIIAAVIVVAAVALSFVIAPPVTPGEQPKSDPVYSIRGQRNE